MDGRNRMVFLNIAHSIRSGFAILQERREICWIVYHAQPEAIYCIGLNGLNQRLVYNIPLRNAPNDFTVLGERFYWRGSE